MARDWILLTSLVAGTLSVSPGATAQSRIETRDADTDARDDASSNDADPEQAVPASAAVAPAPASPPQRETLTGDWGGLRTDLRDGGFTFRADYVSETFAAVDGGVRRGTGYAQQLRGGVDVDLDKTIGWSGALFHFTVNDRRGVGVSSEIVGNRLPIQEDAGGNFTKLTELTLEQNFDGGRVNLRGGYFAMGNDLGGMPLGCNLVNAAFCAHPLSYSGDTGWYNYPNVRWGLAVRYKLRPDVTLRTGVYQVNPALSDRHNAFRLFAAGTIGVLLPIEIEYDPGTGAGSHVLSGHYKLGFYYDTSTAARQGAVGMVTGRYGLYLLGDQRVTRGSAGRGLSLFGQFAVNPKASSPITRWYAAGLVQTGTFAARDADTIALGIIQARVNPRLRELHADLLDLPGGYTSLPVGETAIELNYGIQLRRWLSIRPDVQYIIDPGAFSYRATRNAIALGSQVKIQF